MTSPNKTATATGQSRTKGETGTSELPFNEVGTRELHDRHRIKIEDGDTFARARVTDQTFVDRLLLRKIIEIDQHQAAERLVQQALTAGMFVRTPNWASIPGQHRKETYTNGLLRYSRTLRFVQQNLGYEAASILVRIVVEDRGTEDEEELQVVISCLELLSGRSSRK